VRTGPVTLGLTRDSNINLWFCKVIIQTAFFDHDTYCSRRKQGQTLWHLGQDSSALRSKLSLGWFGTSADLSGQFGATKIVLKCPGSEVSWVYSVRNSTGQCGQCINYPRRRLIMHRRISLSAYRRMPGRVVKKFEVGLLKINTTLSKRRR